MTPPRDPARAVQAAPAFTSTRPGTTRRDATGWVPLHAATRNLLHSASKLRTSPAPQRDTARRPE